MLQNKLPKTNMEQNMDSTAYEGVSVPGMKECNIPV